MFLRQLERLLEDRMTAQDARKFILGIGGTLSDMESADALRVFRRRMMKTLHTDAGGDHNKASMLNQAIDVLLGKNVRPGDMDITPQQNTNYGAAPANTPKWAMAGYTGEGPLPSSNISHQDYTDKNYIKKTMYYLSVDYPDQKQFTLMTFDGYYFRDTITVYGSMKILKEMAEAIFVYTTKQNRSCRAIFFISDRSSNTYLIFLDGKLYIPPIKFEYDSFNMNPANDYDFTRKLPAMLDRLGGR